MLCSPDVDSHKQVITFKTLQSDDRGLFKTFIQGLKSSNETESLLRDMSKASYSHSASAAMNSPLIRSLNPMQLYSAKSDKEAEKHRIMGNNLFKSSKVIEAFQSYSLGIFKASPDSDVLSKLYGNRSACLSRMGHYKEAITDIDEALRIPCSEDFTSKLKDRKRECLEKTDEKNNFVQNLVGSSHSKLSISYGGSSVGRFVTASGDIEAGETILEESPVGAILNLDKRGSHCAVCFLRFNAGYPCRSCCNIAFCSPICRESGTFHEFECKYEDFLRGLGLSSIGRLALRLITSRPLQYFLEIKEYLGDSNETEESISEHAYINIYNLTGNGDQRWKEDKIHRSFLAAVLTKVLESSSYFGCNPNETYIHYICSLIHRNLDVLQFNAHEVYEFVRKNAKSLKPSKQIPIGLAIYQRASYMNHSCLGSTVRYFRGNKIIMRTLHPIQKGEQVYENYGHTFYFKEASQRRKDLQDRYWFQCECQACKEDWPLLQNLPSLSPEASAYFHEKLNQESLQDLVNFIGKHFTSGQMPSEVLVRAMDKLRTVSYNLGTVHILNK